MPLLSFKFQLRSPYWVLEKIQFAKQRPISQRLTSSQDVTMFFIKHVLVFSIVYERAKVIVDSSQDFKFIRGCTYFLSRFPKYMLYLFICINYNNNHLKIVYRQPTLARSHLYKIHAFRLQYKVIQVLPLTSANGYILSQQKKVKCMSVYYKVLYIISTVQPRQSTRKLQMALYNFDC